MHGSSRTANSGVIVGEDVDKLKIKTGHGRDVYPNALFIIPG